MLSNTKVGESRPDLGNYDTLSEDIGGGPRPWKTTWVVNFLKGGTFLFLGKMMAYNRIEHLPIYLYGIAHAATMCDCSAIH